MSDPREDPSGASGWKAALPIARLFEERRGGSLRGDVVGGISACVVMIPSLIAYADLVGLPPAHGLYAALAGMLDTRRSRARGRSSPDPTPRSRSWTEGIALKFARANRPLREPIARLGLGDHLDEKTVFPSVHAAIEVFLRQPSGAAPAAVDAVAEVR